MTPKEGRGALKFHHDWEIQSQQMCQVWYICCAQTLATIAMTLLTASKRGRPMQFS